MGLTNVVQSGLPLKETTEPEKGGCVLGLHGLFALPETKFAPFTVSVNAAPFGLAVAGLRLAISGVFVCVGKIWNGAALIVIPPPGSGFETVTSAVPGDAMSDANTVMAICAVFRFTVDARGEPFQNAVEVPPDPEMNPFPAMKRVKDWLPAVAVDGKSEVMTGVGFGCTLVPVLLELQLDVNTVNTATNPSAVHRKRIKPVLL